MYFFAAKTMYFAAVFASIHKNTGTVNIYIDDVSIQAPAVPVAMVVLWWGGHHHTAGLQP